MIKNFLLYCFFLLLLISCTAGNKTFNKKEYRHSKTLVTYSAMANELEDGYLLLKENGYFTYYQRIWIIGNLKEGAYVGRYAQKSDTVYLNWLKADPRQIKSYLSNKAVMDSSGKRFHFVDERTDEVLWRLNWHPPKGSGK
jgi:hypothetical protein